MEQTRKKPGRRPGVYKEFPFQKIVRMRQEDVENLAELKRLLGVGSESEAVRRAVRETVERMQKGAGD